MSRLFVCFTGTDFSIQSTVPRNMVYHLDIDLFIESCERGHACAMSFSVFNDEHTGYKLELVTSRLNGLISSDSFNARSALLSRVGVLAWLVEGV